MKDHVLQKLTAYVDGELAPRERAAVERLVAADREARQMLLLLQQDARQLQALPRVPAPSDLTSNVLSKLDARVRSKTARRPTTSSPWRAWQSMAAAAIILGMGTASFFLLSDAPRPRISLTHLEPGKATDQPDPKLDRSSSEPPATASEGNAIRAGGDANAGPTEETERPHSPAELPPSRTPIASTEGERSPDPTIEVNPGEFSLPFSEPTYLTSPMLGPTKRFKTMDLKLPPIIDLKSDPLEAALGGLDVDNLHSFDLACNDNARALARFQAACQSAGIRVLVDGPLAPHLGRRIPVQCFAYLENVRPHQLAKVVTALRDLDNKAEEAAKGDGQFGSIMIQTLDEAGRKGVAEALGVTPYTLNPPSPPRSGQSLEPGKPLSDETLKSLEKQSAGQGTGNAGPTTAVILAYHPMRNRATLSKDVRQYLETRRGWQPGALHVLFYFRALRP